jgi:hypothetical protein
MDPGDRAQHQDHEQQRREIEGRDQHAELLQRADAERADGEAHRAKRADRCDFDDVRNDAEKDFAGGVDAGTDLFAKRAHLRHRETSQNRDQQNLQQVTFRERVDERVRNDVHQMIDEAFFLALGHVTRDGLGIERRWIDVETRAGLDDFADQQPDAQRQGRDRFEIEQRFQTDAADLFQVAH